MNNKYTRVIGLFLLIFSNYLWAQQFKKSLSKVSLEDGDTFVFIGNSITHQCAYTQYVEDYFYTRYPNKKLNLINAGVSGDFAQHVLTRLDEDVLKHKPKYVSILIGMNDGQYVKWEHPIFNAYKRDMTTLTNKLDKANVKTILLTPTIYDTQQGLIGENWVDEEDVKDLHYDAVLAYFGAWCAEVATLKGYGYADFHGDLTHYTRVARKDSPDFTFVPDAVHPESDGQLIMALSFLKGIEANSLVSKIVIDKRDDTWIYSADNGLISNSTEKNISFNFKANSLPWVVPNDAQMAFKLTQAGTKMGKELVQIVGLEYGDYELLIDGTVVGTYSHLEFAQGVELQSNEKTPQYQQALRVAEINKARNEELIVMIRDEWLLRKTLEVGWDEDEDEDLEDNEDYQRYLKFKTMGLEKYLEKEFYKVVEELESKSKEMVHLIYNNNQPKMHRYEVR
ncbi:SGNH/GDSL hydrolase family protein [Flagellimonas sp. CMM7]|uniref:SGNH/GDSL hydrolase family protein n=1 Tax=Flagellimonas sp. CMM7 TaxID=2654676 RepID=UPI0013D23F2D|nr:SGNH/GDSL hydrolase family protein [Flagellimonas sp. CMM7]UII79864.1 SGNH/GDSL hydrolase family protein [Flagellimonas sp. CMM7]